MAVAPAFGTRAFKVATSNIGGVWGCRDPATAEFDRPCRAGLRRNLARGSAAEASAQKLGNAGTGPSRILHSL